MKILFIHHGEVPGGAPTSLAYTINALKLELPELEAKVWCMNQQMSVFFEDTCSVQTALIPNPLKETGKVLIGWTKWTQLSVLKTLWKQFRYIRGRIQDFQSLIEKENPDFVHLNSGCLFIPAIAANRLEIPVLWHIREVFGGGKFNLRRIFIGKWIQKLAHHVFCISEVEAKSIGGEKSVNVSVVYNFVDLETFIPNRKADEIRHEINCKVDSKLIISLGGASPRKGLAELLKAFSIVEKQEQEMELIIAGPKLEKPNQKLSFKAKFMLKLESLLYQLGIISYLKVEYENRCRLLFQMIRKKENIHFIGSKTDIVNYIHACDVLYFGGTMPHFPRPIFEAWLMKKPVVAFNEDGIANQIDNEKDGLILYKKNTEALAEAINKLLKNKALADEMGNNGNQKAVLKFNSRMNIKSFISILNLIS